MAVVGLAVMVGVAGCSTRGGTLARPAPEMLPPGSPLLSLTLEDGDAWVRHHLMFGEYALALDLLDGSPVAPRDRLVRALQEGVVLHRAGEYERSNVALEWAEREADRRYTRSVSRGVAALGLGDRSLAYTPSPAELAMVPYYRMLNYLALGEMNGARVEARKANALVAARGGERGGCGEHAMLAYLAGLVQSATGERNDALVSLRVAENAYDACDADALVTPPSSLGQDLYRAARAAGIGDVADSVAARYELNGDPAEHGGDVLLLIEEGFVSHRSAQALHVPIFPEDIEGVDGEDSDGVVAAAARISARLVENLTDRAIWGHSYDDARVVQWANALSGAYVLRLAWPGVRRDPSAPAGLRVFVGDSLASVTTVGEISSLVERDLEAQQPAMLARLVARGLAKFLLARELEQKAEEEGGEVAGYIAGRLANLAANELERADTRSWSLLPDRVSLARLRLAAGRHHLRVETLSPDGEVLRSLDLGEIDVVDGGLIALSSRVWSN
jgi:hypothetical protein